MFPALNVSDLWILSSGIGGLAFFALTVFLLVTRRAALERRLLTVVCAVNTIWAGVLCAAPILELGAPIMDLTEALRTSLWLVLAARILPQASDERRSLRWAPVAIPALLLVFLCWRFYMTQGYPTVRIHHSFVFACGMVIIALWGLVLIEQVFRAAQNDIRWGLKYLCLAIGTLFAYDFFMYSYALLYQRIDIDVWNTRGAVNALLAPLIAISVTRDASWTPRLRVSHQAAFRTTVLIIGGGYLLAMALGSYYIRNFGGTWGEFFAVFFFVAMLLLLAVLLLSGQVRAKASVLINKHFFRYKYDYREEWLALTRRLSSSGGVTDPYQRSIRAVAELLESPAGALWLARENDFTCSSTWNLPAAEETVEAGSTPFVEFLRETRWIIDLDEYRQNPAHYQRVALPVWLDAIQRARLLLPLFSERGLLGFMLLATPRAHYRLTWEDYDLLKTLGRQVGVFLDQQESNQALAQARQFEAFNRLTAFLMHDLKNITAQQSLIVQNAAKHKTNPAFVDDMILTVESSVERMKSLLDQLQRATSHEDKTRRVEVARVLKQVVAGLKQTHPAPKLTGIIDDAAVVHVDPERFTMIVKHIVKNAQDATPADGEVTLGAHRDNATVRIVIQDSGAGMSAAFVRESLFKPFFSTKSSRGMGIGAYQARDFARAAGGDVEVDSTPGRGTIFTLVLPAAATAAPVEAGTAELDGRETTVGLS